MLASLFLLLFPHNQGAPFKVQRMIACVSNQTVSGWKKSATRENLGVSAFLTRTEKKLKDAHVSGAFESNTKEIVADRKFNPREEEYKKFNKYSVLEDDSKFFYLLLPKNFSRAKKPYVGYVQILGEKGLEQTVDLKCETRKQ